MCKSEDNEFKYCATKVNSRGTMETYGFCPPEKVKFQKKSVKVKQPQAGTSEAATSEAATSEAATSETASEKINEKAQNGVKILQIGFLNHLVWI